MSFKTLIIFIFLLINFSSQAQQETVIKGRVTESGTSIGIPFVNIFLKENNQGQSPILKATNLSPPLQQRTLFMFL